MKRSFNTLELVHVIPQESDGKKHKDVNSRRLFVLIDVRQFSCGITHKNKIGLLIEKILIVKFIERFSKLATLNWTKMFIVFSEI